MRVTRLLAAAALVLAGCGPGEKSADAGGNEAAAEAVPSTAAAPAPAAPRPAAAPAPPEPKGAAGSSIPAAFHGVYDVSPEACGRPGDGRLTVTGRELRFHESIGSVRAATLQSPGLVRVEADYQGEGETWSSSHELRLSAAGARLTVSGEGTSFDRVRCAEGGR